MQQWFQNFQFSHISDARYCIYYLQNFLTIKNFKIKDIDFYDVKDFEHWNYITIYIIQYTGETIYGVLKKVDEKYVLELISKEDT